MGKYTNQNKKAQWTGLTEEYRGQRKNQWTEKLNNRNDSFWIIEKNKQKQNKRKQKTESQGPEKIKDKLRVRLKKDLKK